MPSCEDKEAWLDLNKSNKTEMASHEATMQGGNLPFDDIPFTFVFKATEKGQFKGLPEGVIKKRIGALKDRTVNTSHIPVMQNTSSWKGVVGAAWEKDDEGYVRIGVWDERLAELIEKGDIKVSVEELHTVGFSDIWFEGIAFTTRPKCKSCVYQGVHHEGCPNKCGLKDFIKGADKGQGCGCKGGNHSRKASGELENSMLSKLNQRGGIMPDGENVAKTYSMDQVKELLEAEVEKVSAVHSDKHSKEITALTEKHSKDIEDKDKEIQALMHSAMVEKRTALLVTKGFSEDFIKEAVELDAEAFSEKVLGALKEPEGDEGGAAAEAAAKAGQHSEEDIDKVYMNIGSDFWSKKGAN